MGPHQGRGGEWREMSEFVPAVVQSKIKALTEKLEHEHEVKKAVIGMLPDAIEEIMRLLKGPKTPPKVKFEAAKMIVQLCLPKGLERWPKDAYTGKSFDEKKRAVVTLLERMVTIEDPEDAGDALAGAQRNLHRTLARVGGRGRASNGEQVGDVPAPREAGAVSPEPETHSGVVGRERRREVPAPPQPGVNGQRDVEAHRGDSR